jgi:hypothetical protein
MSRCLSVKTLTVTYLALVAILVSSSLASLAQTPESNPSVKSRTVPTLESLPHVPLPRGVFKGWCGQRDRYLLDVDGQIEAYDAGVKYATIAVSSDWPWQCSNDGEQLVYINTNMGYVTRVDIASGDSRLLASYQLPERENTAISFSPDFSSVATTTPLKLTADAGKLNVIVVSQKNPRNPMEGVEQIRWSNDASKLYVAYAFTDIEIHDARGKKVSSGKRPPSDIVDGWFDLNHRALTLFLARNERQDVGSAVRCHLASWKCDRLKSRVDSFSIGGRGITSTVEPLDKLPPIVDFSKTFYSRYAAEIRHPTSGLLARQIYSASDRRWNYAMSVSPTGTKAIVTWDNKQLVGCGTAPDSAKCAPGILINLSKVLE